MKKRNKINTGKSKIGAFTRAAKKAGMPEQEFAKKVLNNKYNYSPEIIKKANFISTVAKWEKKKGGILSKNITNSKRKGGPVKYQDGKHIPVDYSGFGSIDSPTSESTSVEPIAIPTTADINSYADFNISKRFHKDWMSSPMHKQMLKKSAPDNYLKILKTRSQNIKNATLQNRFIKGDQRIPGSLFSGNPSGGYAKGLNYVNQSPLNSSIERRNMPHMRQYNQYYSSLPTHELSHIEDYDPNIPKSIINKFITPIDKYDYTYRNFPKSDVSFIRNLKIKDNKLTKKSEEYYSDPTEVRARLNEIRHSAIRNKQWDPFNEKMTPKNLKWLNLDIMKPRALGDLQQIYSDEQIIDLLNTVSQRDDGSNIQTAQKGGSLPNYQTGKYIPVDYSGFGSIDSPVSESTSTVAPILTNAQKKAVALQDMWNALTDKEKEKVTAINHFKQQASQHPRTKDAPITLKDSERVGKDWEERGKPYTVALQQKIDKVEADRARLNEVGRVALLNNENKGRKSIGQEKTAWNTAMAGVQAGPGMVYSVGLQGIKGLTGSDGGADWSKIQPDFYGIRNNPAYEGQDYSLSKAINDKWAKENPGLAGLIDIGVPLVGGVGWNKAAKLVDNTLDFANAAKSGLGAMPGGFTRSSNSPGNVIVANQLNRNLSDVTTEAALKEVKPNANKYENIIETNPLSQTQARNLVEQGRIDEIYGSFKEGADTIDDFKKSYLKDLISDEGIKRLIAQEADYLRSIGIPESQIAKKAETAAFSRINEIKDIGNINRRFEEGRAELSSVVDNPSNFNNARYRSPDYRNIFDDVLNPESKQQASFFSPLDPLNSITPVRIGEKSAPGQTALGTTYSKSTPTAAHEIGGHGLQADRLLPLDNRLKKLEVDIDDLNAYEKKAYEYFMRGSSGKEPSAFLHEFREAMLQAGLIKNRYQNISPKLIKMAKTYFDRRPSGIVDKGDISFNSSTRIIDFIKPTESNFELLARELNKLPLTIPAIGTAGLLNQQQYKKGGLVKYQKGETISTKLKDWWYNYDKTASGFEMGDKVDDGYVVNWLKDPETARRISEMSKSKDFLYDEDGLLIRNEDGSLVYDIDPTTKPQKSKEDVLSEVGLAVKNIKSVPVFQKDITRNINDLDYAFDRQGIIKNPVTHFSLLNSGAPNIGGYYRPTEHFIKMHMSNTPETKTHELIHATGVYGYQHEREKDMDNASKEKRDWEKKYLYKSQYAKDTYGDYSEENFEKFIKNTKYLNALKHDQKKIDYLKDDGFYPRVMEIRRYLNMKPGQIMTQEMLNKAKSHRAYGDLDMKYDDKNKLEIFNRVAENIQAGDNNIQIVKKGGQVKKDLKGTYTSSAQRLMDDNDLDPSYITASNENGRIYKGDVSKALKSLNNYGAGFPNALDYKKVGVLPKNKIKYSKNTLIGPVGMPPYRWKSYKTPLFNDGGELSYADGGVHVVNPADRRGRPQPRADERIHKVRKEAKPIKYKTVTVNMEEEYGLHPNSEAGNKKGYELAKEGLATGITYRFKCSGGQQCAGAVNTLEQNIGKRLQEEINVLKNDLTTITPEWARAGEDYLKLVNEEIPNLGVYKHKDAWTPTDPTYAETLYESPFYKQQYMNIPIAGRKTPVIYNPDGTLPKEIIHNPLYDWASFGGDRFNAGRSWEYALDNIGKNAKGNKGIEHVMRFGEGTVTDPFGDVGRLYSSQYATAGEGEGQPGQAYNVFGFASEKQPIGNHWGQNKYSLVDITKPKSYAQAEASKARLREAIVRQKILNVPTVYPKIKYQSPQSTKIKSRIEPIIKNTKLYSDPNYQVGNEELILSEPINNKEVYLPAWNKLAQGGNIARTEDEFEEGLNAGKNVFPFGQKGLKKMTSTPPSGDMEVPINMKGFTDGEQTDEQVMLPGEDVNIDGDTVVETPDLSSMDLNKAFDYANSKKFPIFMWKGDEYKLKRHLKKKQRGGLFSSKVTDHVKLNPGFSPDVK